MLGPGPLTAHTVHTVVRPEQLLAQFDDVKGAGYAVDDQEQEIGVRCIAVVVPGAPTPTALSVSGPEARIRLLEAQQAHGGLIPRMQEIATRLGHALAASG